MSLLTHEKEYAVEVFDEEDIKQHVELLRLESGKKISGWNIAQAVWLYIARRNSLPFESAIGHSGERRLRSKRSEALQELLLQAAKECGLEREVKKFLSNGRFNFRPLELEFLRTALKKLGWSKEDFVFD